MLPRRGVIEIELLRRYGRTPAGIRAVGWFKVSATGEDYFTHVWEVRIRVADDPRVVGAQCWFQWAPPRGTSRAASEAGLLERVLREVVRDVEERRTAAKHQRFRVVHAAWQDGTRRGKRKSATPAEPDPAADGGRDLGREPLRDITPPTSVDRTGNFGRDQQGDGRGHA
jgi:hypothetical protein